MAEMTVTKGRISQIFSNDGEQMSKQGSPDSLPTVGSGADPGLLLTF